MITGFVGLAVFIASLFMFTYAHDVRKKPSKYIFAILGTTFFCVACVLMVLGFDEGLRAVIGLEGNV